MRILAPSLLLAASLVQIPAAQAQSQVQEPRIYDMPRSNWLVLQPPRALTVWPEREGELRRGLAELESRNYRAALWRFRGMTDARPWDAVAYHFAGRAAAELGDYRTALRYQRRAVSLNDRLFVAHGEVGILRARLGKVDRARAERDLLAARLAACGPDCADGVAIAEALTRVDRAIAEAE